MANNCSKKERICIHSGSKYVPTSNRQKYCVECRKLVYLTQARAHDKERRTNPKRKEYQKEWRKQNKEYRKEYHKQYYKQNKERYKENNKQWREQNKDYHKQWREQNEEYYKEYKKEYYKKNKERYKENNKQWREQNKEHRREYKKNWSKAKYNTDLQHKLTKWSREQVRRCLNSNKTEHTFDILGYTPEQLKQRLEMNFKPDMTWDNHGTLWHIDHIKPLCKFNFVLPDGTPNYEQIRLANSLTNLQPLYAKENLSKGGK